MSKHTLNSKTERMAGFLELMQEECVRRDLVYADEMAGLAAIWHTGSIRHTDGSVVERLIDGELPIKLARATKKSARKSRATPSLRTSDPAFRKSQRMAGATARKNGVSRVNCPYKDGRGGLRRAWLEGFDKTEVEQ